MIRDLAAVLWMGGGFLLLACLPFTLHGRARTVRDPALAAANDLGSIQLGERRAAIETRYHFVFRRPDGAEVFHHPACPVIRVDLRFSGTPKKPGDDDQVIAVSTPYLSSHSQPRQSPP